MDSRASVPASAPASAAAPETLAERLTVDARRYNSIVTVLPAAAEFPAPGSPTAPGSPAAPGSPTAPGSQASAPGSQPRLPIAVKDVIAVAGVPTTMGSHVSDPTPATASAAVIELCECLGMIPVATTTCQEHSYGILGEASAHGRGVNPIWPGFLTGGSSYGSAIAVATGAVPAALGTDTAGSVRVPAACAGVCGFKPTLGRLPTAGIGPLSASFDTVGLFTAERALLRTLWHRLAPHTERPVPGQASLPGQASVPVPAGPEASAGWPSRVRIALLTAAGHEQAAERIRPWLDGARTRAQAAGRTVELVDLGDACAPGGALDLQAAAEVYGTIRSYETWQVHRQAWEAGRRDFQPSIAARLQDDAQVTDAQYAAAQAACERFRQQAARLLDSVDVVITPTLGCEPVRWEDAGPEVRAAFVQYTQLFNVLGWPAVSVPIESVPRMLPVDVPPDGGAESGGAEPRDAESGGGVFAGWRASFPASVQIAAGPWRDTELIDLLADLCDAPAAAVEPQPAAAEPASSQAEPDAERVVLLREDGQAIGTALKAEVHTAQTALHQAFSCFISDDAGRILLTRRALSKRTWPGVWTNALCGHPAPGEPLAAAVHRRAAEELGCALTDLDAALPAYRYRAEDASGVVENEICPVFTARLTGELAPRAAEVCEWAWIAPADLDAAVAAAPFLFSPWMQEEWQLLRARRTDGTDR